MPMNWLLAGPGSPYVLDITLTIGTTQIIFATSFPGDQSTLTAADADSLAATVQTAVEAISGVTAVTLAQIEVNGAQWRDMDSAYPGALTFPAAQWANWLGGWPADPAFSPLEQSGYKITSTLGVITRSPADGMLTAAQITTVTDALAAAATALAGMPVTLTRQALTPASAL